MLRREARRDIKREGDALDVTAKLEQLLQTPGDALPGFAHDYQHDSSMQQRLGQARRRGTVRERQRMVDDCSAPPPSR